GKFPEQAPVNEFVWIETVVGPAVEKGFPVDVLRRAIGGHRAQPLTFPMRCVAAHPGLHLSDSSGHPVLNPLARIRKRTGTFALQPDLIHAKGFFRLIEALFCFMNELSYCLLQ